MKKYICLFFIFFTFHSCNAQKCEHILKLAQKCAFNLQKPTNHLSGFDTKSSMFAKSSTIKSVDYLFSTDDLANFLEIECIDGKNSYQMRINLKDWPCDLTKKEATNLLYLLRKFKKVSAKKPHGAYGYHEVFFYLKVI